MSDDKIRWKSISFMNLPNYKISNDANIKNIKTGSMLFINYERIKKHGRRAEVKLLNKHGLKKSYLLHRLVAFAFVKKRKGATQVDHIDNDKYNNISSNLQWLTVEEHAKKNSKHNNKSNGGLRPVLKICKKTKKIIEEYKSLKEASFKNNVSTSHLSGICNKRSLYKGFIWKYKPIENIDGELWKKISVNKFRNYSVSNYGRIKNNKTKQIIKQNVRGDIAE